MHLDVRSADSPQASEIYITVIPAENADLADQAKEAFSAIRETLARRNAWIWQERVFADTGEVKALRSIRKETYGRLDDGIEPAWLGGCFGAGKLAAVQVHAVSGITNPTLLPGGRLFAMNGLRWLVASGIRACDGADAPAQARRAFEKIEGLLKQAGATLHDVARTWIFMDRILEWYPQFNQVRTEFFLERGLLGPSADGRMPASTGIGVSPANGARCAMDLFAVMGTEGAVKRYHAAGKQRSAYEYGSAFARAARARTPAGQTLFVSGTAAIDESGATCFVDDIRGQIRMTMENILAVLRERNCQPQDAVQAIAYCVNEQVAEAFSSGWKAEVPWPWVTLKGDICRPDLLFEVEVTACAGARRTEPAVQPR